ncbi:MULTISPECIES: hypothetical protein [unclassified Mesorhizobium]|uniref:hypothetical protein n=1 Tax=unclassified Mesorhizobium TaxID=325217 RepID=UPI00333C1C66
MKCLVWSIFAILFSTWAHAHVPPTGPAYAKEFFAKFDELLRQRQIEGKLPSLEDPTDRDLLRKIWDGEALIGSPPYDASDLETLPFVMDRSGSLLILYGQASPLLLQDEATQSFVLVIRAAAASQPAFNDFLAHQANAAEMLRANGAKARGGVEKMFRGASIFLADPVLKERNKIVLIESLRAGGPYLAESVSPGHRQALIDLFVPSVGQLPVPAQESLKIFIQKIKAAGCNLLCADGM